MIKGDDDDDDDLTKQHFEWVDFFWKIPNQTLC